MEPCGSYPAFIGAAVSLATLPVFAEPDLWVRLLIVRTGSESPLCHDERLGR